jgi:hypothetical protein
MGPLSRKPTMPDRPTPRFRDRANTRLRHSVIGEHFGASTSSELIEPRSDPERLVRLLDRRPFGTGPVALSRKVSRASTPMNSLGEIEGAGTPARTG